MTGTIARERIYDAYRRGERRIEVPSDVFRAYDDSLMAIERLGPPPQNGRLETPKWLAFKDAWVVECAS